MNISNLDNYNLISALIANLKGKPDFENFIMSILREAGFNDVTNQSSGFQGGFDIKGYYEGLEWRFEAKKKKPGEALTESDLATKFDQIEREPGYTEYFIIVTNTNLSNPTVDSVKNHRYKWLIDLDYWSSCNDKFRQLLLSYPEPVIKELKLTEDQENRLREESKKYLETNSIFLEQELENLRVTSNRFILLQKVANSISSTQEQKVKPLTDFSKLIPRKSANDAFEQFKPITEYSSFFLIAKEQMGKSSLLRLWAKTLREVNIVFFFTAGDICHPDWITKIQSKVFPEIEKLSSDRLQVPQFLSTIFERMQPRLRARKASIYIFVDALNIADYEDVKAFFDSDDFRKSLSDWKMNWVFSCREAVWKQWKEYLSVVSEDKPQPLEYKLQELEEDELEAALKTHKIEQESIPYWLRPKLKWPGFLRLCEVMLQTDSNIFKNMPEMALAEISLMFIKDRIDEFARLHPGEVPISIQGVEGMVEKVIKLFKEQGYRRLPFAKIQTIPELNPHLLAENSWNILLRQGFLTADHDRYELGNDWGTILIGRHLIDTCMRTDLGESEVAHLLDEIFDGIAPIVTEGKIRSDESERFEGILWFALHYAKIRNIPESIFQMILDRIIQGQNLSHESLCAVSVNLFPQFSTRYLAQLPNKIHESIYIRQALEKAPAEIVIPEIIKRFPDASDEIKPQLAILLSYYNDMRFLEDIYKLLDEGLLPTDMDDRYLTKFKLSQALESFPDECTKLIHSLWMNGKIRNRDLAISLLGWIGNAQHQSLLQEMIKDQSKLSIDALEAMGRLLIPQAEEVSMKILEEGNEHYLKSVAIESLGHLQSNRFLDWCQNQADLWKTDHYLEIIKSLEKFESSEAYDLIISLELQQRDRTPFFISSPTFRLKKITKKQFEHMVTGIINSITFTSDLGQVRRGLMNLSTLNSKKLQDCWKDYINTQIPRIIAGVAKLCAQKREFNTRGQTDGSMAINEALKILNWIGDRGVFIPLLLELMKKEIPRLFAWTLFEYVIIYSDQCYKDTLIKMAKYESKYKEWENIYDQVQSKAIFCLTYLQGDDVAEIILKYFPTEWSIEDFDRMNSLNQFNEPYFVQELVEILKTRNEQYFPGTYIFLSEFLPKEAIEPSLSWLNDDNCKDWIRRCLLKLLGKYDKQEVNNRLLELSRYANIYVVDLIQAIFQSLDPKIHDWFKEKIREKALSENLFPLDKVEHWLLLKWILKNEFKESKPYIEKWLTQDTRSYFSVQSIFPDLYKIIDITEFHDLLHLVKKIYYKWNPNWGYTIILETLKLFSKYDPDWSWQEFLNYWNNSNDFQRKILTGCVQFMPSEKSIEWLLNTFSTIGDKQNSNDEIESSVKRIISKFHDHIRVYGINSLEKNSVSENTKDRIIAAQCSGLFGDLVYEKLKHLSRDSCAKVRGIYRYVEINY